MDKDLRGFNQHHCDKGMQVPGLSFHSFLHHWWFIQDLVS